MLNGTGGSNSERVGVQSKGQAKKNPACCMKRLGIPNADYTPKNCFFTGLSLSENNFWDSKNLHYVHVLLNYISHYKTII